MRTRPSKRGGQLGQIVAGHGLGVRALGRGDRGRQRAVANLRVEFLQCVVRFHAQFGQEDLAARFIVGQGSGPLAAGSQQAQPLGMGGFVQRIQGQQARRHAQPDGVVARAHTMVGKLLQGREHD